MFYPDETVEEVRAASDIVDVISAYVRLERKGGNHFGLCPFHSEKSPSFSVTRSKQMYYCFGCGAGGNVFTFIMQYENFTFGEAIKFLADRSGISLPEIQYSKAAKAEADLKATIFEINKIAAKYYYSLLKSEQGAYASAYLNERGISAEMVQAFGLGYASKYKDDLYKYLLRKGFNEEQIRQARLIVSDEKKGNYEYFFNRLMFPIMDANSRVIAFGGRVLGDGKPKYLNSPETPIFNKSRNLYGLNRARTARKPYFLVCEGYTDVIALHQAGFTNAVATLGTALTMGHATLIKRYVSEVYLCYDSDEAGVRAAMRGIPLLHESGITTKAIDMTPYKDPDLYIKELGSEAFEKCIGTALNGFFYMIKVLEKGFDLHSPDGKTRFFMEVATKLLMFQEELERNNYLEAIAKEYVIEVGALKELVKKQVIQAEMIKTPQKYKKSYHRDGENDAAEFSGSTENGFLTSKQRNDPSLHAQKVLLTWMLEDIAIFQKASDFIRPTDFTKELYQKVATYLYEQYKTGEVNPSQILNHFTLEDEHLEVASLFHSQIKALNGAEAKEQALRETIIKVKEGAIHQFNKKIDPSDMKAYQALMVEKKNLEAFKRRK